MDLQFEPHARVVSSPPLRAPYGRMHLVRDGFLYAGLVAGQSSQRHSAVVYLALGDTEFTLEAPGSRLHASAALVGPGVRKRFTAGRVPVVCLDICPTHRSYHAFAQDAAPLRSFPREHFDTLNEALRQFHEGHMRSAEAGRLYDQVVALAARRMPEVRPLDPRVREVMRLLREDRHRSTQELADAVCLSKDWLAHLFQREAGISLRKYEQTLKLQAAAAYVHRGVSMTEVAAVAGFADSAHFSKMWKQHYGAPPRQLFTDKERITIDPLPWPSCIERPPGAEVGADAA
jgi:AraC-like DNA-binding protein